MEREHINKLLSVAFFILLTVALLEFHNNGDSYHRNDSFFVMMAVMVALVFVQIMRSNDSKGVSYLIFLELFLIPLIFLSTGRLLYETQLGRDPWTHERMVSWIVHSGNIPSFEQIRMEYANIPFYHIIISISIILTNVTYNWGFFISIGLATLIIEVLSLVGITRLFCNDSRLPYICALLAINSDNVLYMIGIGITPNSIGAALSLLILFMLFRMDTQKPQFILCILLMSIALVFTHTISYTYLIMQTFIVLLVSYFLFKNQARNFQNLFMFFVVLGISVWLYISWRYFQSLVVIFEKLFIWGIDIERYESALPVTFNTVILARLGMIMFFAISAVVSLWIIFDYLKKLNKSKTRRSENASGRLFTYAILSVFFIGMGLTFLTPSLSSVAHRFWYYGELMGSVPLGIGLLTLWKSSRRCSIPLKSLIVFLILLLSLFMFTSNIANDDNPMVEEYSIRTGWYDSEVTCAKFLMFKCYGNFTTDFDFGINTLHLAETLKVDHSLQYLRSASLNDAISLENSLFVLRFNLIENRAFQMGGKTYNPLHSQTFQLHMETTELRSLIYSSETVMVYR